MLQAAATMPGSTIPIASFVGAVTVIAGFYGLVVTVLYKLAPRWGAFLAPAIAIGGFAAILLSDPTFPGPIEPRWLLGVGAIALLTPLIAAPLVLMVQAKRRGTLSFLRAWVVSAASFVGGLVAGSVFAGIVIGIAALFYRGIVA